MTDTVLAQLVALKAAPAPVLKAKWRELFDREPPPYNRRFLESRLAYRIQELAYGGLKRETVERLRVLAKEKDGNQSWRCKMRSDSCPGRVTRFGRAREGNFHIFTIRGDYFEYQGHPCQYL